MVYSENEAFHEKTTATMTVPILIIVIVVFAFVGWKSKYDELRRWKNTGPRVLEDGTVYTPGSDPPTPLPTSDEDWHEVYTLPGGARVGQMGAMSYLIDDDGEPLTYGYHSFNHDGSKGATGTWIGPVKKL